jgi:hypothetical protein
MFCARTSNAKVSDSTYREIQILPGLNILCLWCCDPFHNKTSIGTIITDVLDQCGFFIALALQLWQQQSATMITSTGTTRVTFSNLPEFVTWYGSCLNSVEILWLFVWIIMQMRTRTSVAPDVITVDTTRVSGVASAPIVQLSND